MESLPFIKMKFNLLNKSVWKDLFTNFKKDIRRKTQMRMLCRKLAQSGETIEGSPADKTWLKFNFEIIPPAFKIP